MRASTVSLLLMLLLFSAPLAAQIYPQWDGAGVASKVASDVEAKKKAAAAANTPVVEKPTPGESEAEKEAKRLAALEEAQKWWRDIDNAVRDLRGKIIRTQDREVIKKFGKSHPTIEKLMEAELHKYTEDFKKAEQYYREVKPVAAPTGQERRNRSQFVMNRERLIREGLAIVRSFQVKFFAEFDMPFRNSKAIESARKKAQSATSGASGELNRRSTEEHMSESDCRNAAADLELWLTTRARDGFTQAGELSLKMAEDPTNIDTLFALADALHSDNDKNMGVCLNLHSRLLLERIIEQRPDYIKVIDGTVPRMLADTYGRVWQYDEGVGVLEKAIEYCAGTTNENAAVVLRLTQQRDQFIEFKKQLGELLK